MFMKPITINPNVVISTTQMDPEGLDRFFQGESAALTLERYRTAGVKPVQSLFHVEKKNGIDLTPAYFRKKRDEEERRRRREEYQKRKASEIEEFRYEYRFTPCR